jgi:hypothetical protein
MLLLLLAVGVSAEPHTLQWSCMCGSSSSSTGRSNVRFKAVLAAPPLRSAMSNMDNSA